MVSRLMAYTGKSEPTAWVGVAQSGPRPQCPSPLPMAWLGHQLGGLGGVISTVSHLQVESETLKQVEEGGS